MVPEISFVDLIVPFLDWYSAPRSGGHLVILIGTALMFVDAAVGHTLAESTRRPYGSRCAA